MIVVPVGGGTLIRLQTLTASPQLNHWEKVIYLTSWTIKIPKEDKLTLCKGSSQGTGLRELADPTIKNLRFEDDSEASLRL